MMGGKKAEVDYSTRYFTLKALQSGTFRHTNFAVQYSTDGGTTWNTLSSGSSTPTVTAGTKVLFKGTITPSSAYGVGTFTGSGNFETEGNVMSLLYGDNFVGQVDLTGKDYAFYNLFGGAGSLKSAKNLLLPATTLAQYCYANMFYNCTKLTSAPAELPATTLALRCYYRMFMYCTSLATAPALPATTLADSCYYYMFSNCPLTTAPELPATTMANACYAYMFGKAKFTTIELPATTLANQCYQGMFGGCKNLTTIELPATTLKSNCYSYMFVDCTNLSYIKAMFTTEPSDTYTKNWVSKVASSGTFVKNSAATWNVTGANGVPSGWTVETAAA
jgi:hypothetical protein